MDKLLLRRDFSIPHLLLTNNLTGISDAPPPPDALFWGLWNSCAEIAKNVLETDYFKGIKNGNLDPRFYGRLINQDAYYCFKGQDSYNTAANNAENEDFYNFFIGKGESYARYNETFHAFWHIRDAQGIMPGDDIKTYSDFEAHVAQNFISPYMLCAMLPCEYLWPWIASQLDPVTPPNSLYRFWIGENTGFNGAYQMGNFLELYRGMIDQKQAIDIYSASMQYELETFTSATILSTGLCHELQKNTIYHR